MYIGNDMYMSNIGFYNDVSLRIGPSATVKIARVITRGFSLTKSGEGILVIAGENPGWDGVIKYGTFSDSIVLEGTLGQNTHGFTSSEAVSNTTFYDASGIIPAADTVSKFIINQNDTVVQTFNFANSPSPPGSHLIINHYGSSFSRFIHTDSTLSASFSVRDSGTLYIEGLKQVGHIRAMGKSRIITGGGHASAGYAEVTRFDNPTNQYVTEAFVIDDSATLRIGAIAAPSLAVIDGEVQQRGRLEIDVFDPDSFAVESDQILIDSGWYVFGDEAAIQLNIAPQFEAYIEPLEEYFLPVIMLQYPSAARTIEGADNVNVIHNVSSDWQVDFVKGDGNNGTVQNWGYVRFRRIRVKMTKSASLNGVAGNGSYPNPVAVLGNERITYSINAINTNSVAGAVVVSDTLPPYMTYVAGTALPAAVWSSTGAYPPQEVLTWTFHNLPGGDTARVSFEATPSPGACASQPLFVNIAHVRVGGSKVFETNATFHQGAGISIVTFASAAGGTVFNAEKQAVDYMSSPSSGVVAVPDSGYRFAGWRHEGYYSLRGAFIAAQRGIMRYDTLKVYGNVQLTAEFEALKDTVAHIPDTPLDAEESRVWAADGVIFVRAPAKDCVIKVYNADGVLLKSRQASATEELTHIHISPRGVYIVTISGCGRGWKVRN